MNKTSRPGFLIVALLCGGVACAATQKSLPPPLSVALHPSPKAPGEQVRVLVDVIPASAVTYNLDTISLRSSQDPLTEDVWLPGCDQPLKVSLAHPELEVSIFKRVDAP